MFQLGAVALIALAAASRLLPHPPNFTATGAIALFAGAYLAPRWLALLVPLAALWISDMVLNIWLYAEFRESWLWYPGAHWNYLGVLVLVVIGSLLLRNVTAGRVLGASLTASLVFFGISNFGVWASGTLYPTTLEGLAQCFVMALPFLPNTVAGDLLFCALLFGGFAVYRKYVLENTRVTGAA